MFISRTTILFSEPVIDERLDVLERNLPKVTSAEDRLKIAAILYRYGRDAGEAYLDAQLQQHLNVDSATVFALNQCAEKKSLIIQSFLFAYSPKARFNAETTGFPCWFFPHAMGNWIDPDISDALRQAFVAKRSVEGYLVFALAKHQRTDCIPLFERRFNRLSDDESPEKSGLKADFAVALIKMGADFAPAYNYLFEVDYATANHNVLSALLFAIGQTKLYEAKPFVTDLLDFCLQNKHQFQFKTNLRFIVGDAVRALRTLSPVEAEAYTTLINQDAFYSEAWKQQNAPRPSYMEQKQLPPDLRFIPPFMLEINPESYEQALKTI